MRYYFKSFFDLILPRICISCTNKLFLDESKICASCFDKLEYIPKDLIEKEYQRKFADENLVTDFNSLFLYNVDSPIHDLTHNLKYNGKFKLGIFIGELIGEYFSEIIKNWEADYILPIPLHTVKKAERGYNQSFYICKGISRKTKVPISKNSIRRTKFTETQTQLNSKQRKKNIENAFELKSKISFDGKNIIIVDDVITTGATISECAKVLKNNGAENIYALSSALAE